MARARKSGLRIVAVLGGVGSGKSTAARLLAAALAAPHLDADQEVGRLWADPGFLKQLAAEFGPDWLGPVARAGELPETSGEAVDAGGEAQEVGSVRQQVGRRVFDDPAARARLEALIHPQIRRVLWQSLDQAEKQGGWAVLDVPLLLENGLSQICDFLVYVEAPAALRWQRAAARHGWSEADWRRREAAQAPLEQKKNAAHAILDNAGGVPDLDDQVQALLPAINDIAPRPLRDRWPSPAGPPRVVSP